ncbi:MAG: hypothetical protein APF76_00680 [Desulfitibacter sp. BRH_c19]|nr:MAG: hypothetical protein APF76_00680 [Desulfitibacter sp. BRH_c19]
MKLSKILLVFILLSISSYTLFTFSQNVQVSYETSFANLIEEEVVDRQLMLVGLADPDSVQWDSSLQELSFYLTDGEYSIPVVYNKPISTVMDLDEVEIMVEGYYREGVFNANKLQTRCPSKYDAK